MPAAPPSRAPGCRADRTLLAASYFAVAGVLAAFLSRNLVPHLRFEDAFIVLRYARNLAAGEGFVYNAGERVLGVTTPLQTLLSTVFVALAPEVAPALQNAAGLVFLVLEGWMVALLVRRAASVAAALLAAVLTLANLNLSYLYLGMEVHLYAFLVLLAFHLFLEGRPARTGLVLGLAFLTRYDAALPAGMIGLSLLLERRRIPWRLVLGFAVPVVPWLLFAVTYFGTILPAPFGAKEDNVGFAAYLLQVFYYYKATFKTLLGLYTSVELLKAGLSYLYPVALALGAWRWLRRDRRLLPLALLGVLHVLVYAAIGSDPAFTWHYYVLNPLVFALAATGVEAALAGLTRSWRQGWRPAWRRPAAALLLVAVAVSMLPLLGKLQRDARYVYEVDPGTRQLTEMGSWLRDRYDAGTSLLYPAIGVVGWVSGLVMVDHAGLVTPGLYFHDEERCTPLAEVLRDHAPDLVLLSDRFRRRPGVEDLLAARGYALAHVFAEPNPHYLYRSQSGGSPDPSGGRAGKASMSARPQTSPGGLS